MTFAGTPDRVESRLVPEAGFELDTFPVSGLPRRPSAASSAQRGAHRPPPHCFRILARRRPDVVLGGGGFVAGPMVLAARLRGIPAALTEADAHLGLANRLAAPFAARLFLAYEIPGATGGRSASSGGRSRSRIGRTREGRERFGLAADGRRGGLRRLAGARSLNELAVSAWGLGAVGAAHLRRARLRRSARASSGTTTSCSRRPTTSARRSQRPTSPCRGPAGRSGSSPRPARRRSSSRTRTRRRTTRRSTPGTSSAGEAVVVRTPRSTASRRSSTSSSPTSSGSRAMREAMSRSPGRTRRRSIATSGRARAAEVSSRCTGPLAGRRCTSSGSRLGDVGLRERRPRARRRGGRVGRHETIFSETLDGIEVDLGGEPRPPDGFEVVVSTAHRDRIAGTPRGRVLAELVAARPFDRRHGRARQDDDRRDDRPRAPRDR